MNAHENNETWLIELAELPVADLSAEKARALRENALAVLRKRAHRDRGRRPAQAPAALRLAARLAGGVLGAGWLGWALLQAARFLRA